MEGVVPDDFELRRTKDGRVFVVLHPSCAISAETILALLAQLGIDTSAVVFLAPEDAAHCDDLDGAVVLIPIDQSICDAPELDLAGRQCGQAGGRVVILFGEAFPYQGLHPVAEKYGTQCGWSAEQLDACLSGPDAVAPRNSGGLAVARPKSQQVKC